MHWHALTGHVNPASGRVVLQVARACSFLGAARSDDLLDRQHFGIVEAACVAESFQEEMACCWARRLVACRSAEMEAFRQG
jgi:hypothetical protein